MRNSSTRQELARKYVETERLAKAVVPLLREALAKESTPESSAEDATTLRELTELCKHCAEALAMLRNSMEALAANGGTSTASAPITFAHPAGVFAEPVDREQVRVQAEKQLQQHAADASRQMRGEGTALAAERSIPATAGPQ